MTSGPRVRVVFIGEDARDPIQVAAADYLARAGRRYDAGLVPLKRGKGDRTKQSEADALLDASDGCTRVALDPRGKLQTSEELARALEGMLAKGKVAFLVGGAAGLDARVLAESAATWSLSPLTFAHRLAVLVVAEQIYRAAEIARGGPYAR